MQCITPLIGTETCTTEDLIRHHEYKNRKYTISGRSGHENTLFEYTLILGDSINQKNSKNGKINLLGKYVRVEDGTEFYLNGDGCPNNLIRQATITFVQGEEPKLLSASEPSMCKYEFKFQINCKGTLFNFETTNLILREY